MSAGALRGQKVLHPELELHTGTCKPPDEGAGNQIQFSSRALSSQVILSSIHPPPYPPAKSRHNSSQERKEDFVVFNLDWFVFVCFS